MKDSLTLCGLIVLPSEHFVDFSLIEGGSLDGGGSNNGSVEVTGVDDTTIAMEVSYSDTIGEDSYSIEGSFEAIRCQD